MKISITATGLFLFATTLPAQEKITYADHVRPLLENKCFSCHNSDKKKGDLDLTNFAGMMTGGGGGAVVNSGDAESSRLITTTTKKEEPFMPPEGAPLSAKEVEILTKWIQGGVLETASSIAKKAQPKANLTLTVSSKGKPEGPPPMPEHVLLEPVLVAPRNTAVTALAASPWAPLVALSGMKQAMIYDTDSKVLAGIYPYPEGYLRSLKFSQNGSLLIGGGGQGGKFGNAVIWDVKTGKRVAEVGKEFDQVMSADISPNHAMIALGGPSKKLKCFNTSTGEELYVMKKHTEWVLAVSFSPDGVLLASADRNGGVFVSEAASGGEFYVMDSHKTACTSLAWRADSNILASSGEDGKIFTYEMENGKVVKSWDAHAGGVLAVSFTPEGNIVSSGRDGRIRVWDINGKKISESKPQPDIVTEVAALHDSKTGISGDWLGNVKLWSLDKFEEKGVLSSNPAPIAQRIVESEQRAGELTAQVPVAEASFAKADETSKAKEAELNKAKQTGDEFAANKKRLEGELAALPGQIDVANKAITEAQANRQAQLDLWKKHEEHKTQIKQVEGAMVSLTAERAKLIAPEQATQAAETDRKLNDLKGQLEPLKQAVAATPEPIDQLDKRIKELQDQVAALNVSKPAKEKELAEVSKKLEQWPPHLERLGKELVASQAVTAAAQIKLTEVRGQLTFYQKLPTALRAAQFNVGLLSEKDKLEKLEADVKSYQEALAETEAAKLAATQRIADNQKVMADATAALPGLQGTFEKLAAEFPAIEKTLEPSKTLEAQSLALVDAQKKILGEKDAELKGLEQAKAIRVAAAQKAAEEITKQMAALEKQLVEVNGKLAGPEKTFQAKKEAFAAASKELDAANVQKADAEKLLAQKGVALKTAEGASAAGQETFTAAQKEAPAIQDQQKATAADVAQKQTQMKQKEAELTAANQAAKPELIAPLQKEIDDLKPALAASEKVMSEANAKLAALEQSIQEKKTAAAQANVALEAARKSQKEAQAALTAANGEGTKKQNVVQKSKAELDGAEKAAAPLWEQRKNLQVQIDKQKTELAEKQAEPGKADQEFAAKSAPVSTQIAQVKTALEPLEKQLAEVRVKLAAEVQMVEAKRAEVGKAQADAEGAKKRSVESQKTIETSTKEIAEKDNSLTEIKGELAKQEPQLQPLRDKVKQLNEQYFAMLPK